MSDSDHYNEFIDYVNEGNYKYVREYLVADLVDPSQDESYALRIACAKGYVKIVELLIKDGRSDLRAKNHEPLLSVCENNNLSIAKLILKERAKQLINIAYKDNEPIMVCCEHGSLDVLKYLVMFRRYEDSINPGARDSEALFIAIEFHHPDVVKYLLTRQEINPLTRNNKALILASDGRVMEEKQRKTDSDQDSEPEEEQPEEKKSMRKGSRKKWRKVHNTKCLKVLLGDDRINPRQTNESGIDPLMMACQTNNVDAVKVLLNDPRTNLIAGRYRAFRFVNHFEEDTTGQDIMIKSEIMKLFIKDERTNKSDLLRVIVKLINDQVEEDSATEDLFVHLGMIIKWFSDNNTTLSPLPRIYDILNSADPKYSREILLNYNIDNIPLNRYNFHLSPKKKEDRRFIDYLIAKFPYKKDRIFKLIYRDEYQPEYEEEVKNVLSKVIKEKSGNKKQPVKLVYGELSDEDLSELPEGKSESAMEIPGLENNPIGKTISEYLFGKRESQLETEVRKVMRPQKISKIISEYLE